MYYIRKEETFVHLRSICYTSDAPLFVQIKEITQLRATQTVIFVFRAVMDGVKKYAPPFETTKLEGIVKSLPGVVGSVPDKERGAPVLFCPTAYMIELEMCGPHGIDCELTDRIEPRRHSLLDWEARIVCPT